MINKVVFCVLTRTGEKNSMKRAIPTFLYLSYFFLVASFADTLAASVLKPKQPISIVEQIKALRQKGDIVTAKNKANNYLKTYPRDADVLLLLGLLERQSHRLQKAAFYLTKALHYYPRYLDVRVALIRLQLQKKNHTKALSLTQKGLALHPHNPTLLAIKEKILAVQEKASSQAVEKSSNHSDLQLLKNRPLDNTPSFVEETNAKPLITPSTDACSYRIALANQYLSRHQDMRALLVIRDAKRQCPQNYMLLLKEGEIHTLLHQYSLAASAYQEALQLSPLNKKIQALLAEIDEHSPRYRYGVNEIGAWTDNAYVNDLHSVWNYSSIYYARDTDFGRFSAKLNYAARIHNAASQYEIDFSPRFTRNIVVDLMAAYADNPILFPNYSYGAEGYITLFPAVEISGGIKNSQISNTFFNTWTSSINLYWKNYWLSLRPYYFVPQSHSPVTHLPSQTSLLYTARMRRYFATDDHYIGISAGTGLSPDFTDLQTVNFIVIKNSFINIDYSFPLFNYKLIVNLGTGYQRWKYPSGLLRNLYGGSIGVKYRFS